MAAVCPRSSVEYRTAGRSGFQMRSVRSAEPVAISWPAGFHASERMLLQKRFVNRLLPTLLLLKSLRMRSGSFGSWVVVVLGLEAAEDDREVVPGEEFSARRGSHSR